MAKINFLQEGNYIADQLYNYTVNGNIESWDQYLPESDERPNKIEVNKATGIKKITTPSGYIYFEYYTPNGLESVEKGLDYFETLMKEFYDTPTTAVRGRSVVTKNYFGGLVGFNKNGCKTKKISKCYDGNAVTNDFQNYNNGNGWNYAKMADVTKMDADGNLLVKGSDGNWYYAVQHSADDAKFHGDKYFTQNGGRGASPTLPATLFPVAVMGSGFNKLDGTNNYQTNLRGYIVGDTSRPYSETIAQTTSGVETRTFNDAYREAVNAGLDTFIFEGKTYNTANNPNITEEQKQLGNTRTEYRTWTGDANGNNRQFTEWSPTIASSYQTNTAISGGSKGCKIKNKVKSSRTGGSINYLKLF